jgi:hypothetical protein
MTLVVEVQIKHNEKPSSPWLTTTPISARIVLTQIRKWNWVIAIPPNSTCRS